MPGTPSFLQLSVQCPSARAPDPAVDRTTPSGGLCPRCQFSALQGGGPSLCPVCLGPLAQVGAGLAVGRSRLGERPAGEGPYGRVLRPPDPMRRAAMCPSRPPMLVSPLREHRCCLRIQFLDTEFPARISCLKLESLGAGTIRCIALTCVFVICFFRIHHHHTRVRAHIHTQTRSHSYIHIHTLLHTHTCHAHTHLHSHSLS